MKQAKDDDYLEPPRDFFSLYPYQIRHYSEIRRLLLKDTDDPEMARLMCFPYLNKGPEWWIRIRETKEQAFEIQAGQASISIALTLERQDSQALSRIIIRRWDAPLADEVARRITCVWQRAIRACRYRSRVPVEQSGGLTTITVNFHSWEYFFDSDDATGRIVAYIESPPERSLPFDMIQLAARLKDYTQSSPAKHASLLLEISDRLNRVEERQQKLYPTTASR
jgi:hypothetical protein